MSLTILADPVPLRTDEYGVIRVGGSRYCSTSSSASSTKAADPEGIVHSYPTLNLADVYAAITYYLRRRKEVDEYLQARREEAERLRQEIEAKQPNPAELRAKLLARKGMLERDHASSGQ